MKKYKESAIKISTKIGRKLSKTSFGVYIIAHSYVHERYEWYRTLILDSEYTHEEIRRLIRKDDQQTRASWLFARSDYARMHCTEKELKELTSYLKKDDESKALNT